MLEVSLDGEVIQLNPQWNIRRLVESWNTGDYKVEFIVRILVAGIKGLTSKVLIDVYPFPKAS